MNYFIKEQTFLKVTLNIFISVISFISFQFLFFFYKKLLNMRLICISKLYLGSERGEPTFWLAKSLFFCLYRLWCWLKKAQFEIWTILLEKVIEPTVSSLVFNLRYNCFDVRPQTETDFFLHFKGCFIRMRQLSHFLFKVEVALFERPYLVFVRNTG